MASFGVNMVCRKALSLGRFARHSAILSGSSGHIPVFTVWTPTGVLGRRTCPDGWTTRRTVPRRTMQTTMWSVSAILQVGGNERMSVEVQRHSFLNIRWSSVNGGQSLAFFVSICIGANRFKNLAGTQHVSFHQPPFHAPLPIFPCPTKPNILLLICNAGWVSTGILVWKK